MNRESESPVVPSHEARKPPLGSRKKLHSRAVEEAQADQIERELARTRPLSAVRLQPHNLGLELVQQMPLRRRDLRRAKEPALLLALPHKPTSADQSHLGSAATERPSGVRTNTWQK